jgi:hypothetical protein
MDDFNRRAQGFQDKYYKKDNEGNITIDFGPAAKKQYSKDSGEYIDYEEIKE